MNEIEKYIPSSDVEKMEQLRNLGYTLRYCNTENAYFILNDDQLVAESVARKLNKIHHSVVKSLTSEYYENVFKLRKIDGTSFILPVVESVGISSEALFLPKEGNLKDLKIQIPVMAIRKNFYMEDIHLLESKINSEEELIEFFKPYFLAASKAFKHTLEIENGDLLMGDYFLTTCNSGEESFFCSHNSEDGSSKIVLNFFSHCMKMK